MIRLAMIGGSHDSMIGPTHVAAASWIKSTANRSDSWLPAKVVAGSFSRRPEVNKAAAKAFGVEEARTYDSLEALLEKESPSSLDAVVVATPNQFHIPYSALCLKAGFSVMCEKPLGYPVGEAKKIAELATQKGLSFALAHHNTAWPAIEYLRKAVSSGDIGEVRLVRGSYIQGWLSEDSENKGNAQAAWRTHPDLSGPSCCFFDIGSHILNLGSYVTGENPEFINGTLQTFVPGRKLDDACQFTVRHGPALGTYAASQVSTGFGNHMELSVEGSKGSFSWSRESPMSLVWRSKKECGTKEFAADPWPNHLSAFSDQFKLDLENTFAFANLYQSFFQSLSQNSTGCKESILGRDHAVGIYTAETLQRLLAASGKK
jgi:predicted dehydrogenase